MKTVSKQSSDIYKLLLGVKPMTAQQIADRLDILPNAVYRVADKLTSLGMIEKSTGYPVTFTAKNPHTAMNWYLLAVAQNFKNDFKVENQVGKNTNSPSISFIKDRAHCIEKELIDLRCTKKTYNYIVSGHDVPDEMFHETRKAILRGVKVRKIIHQKGQINSQYNKALSEIGVETRYLPGIEFRMFVFDSQIVTLTSYDDERNYKGFGVRFAYAPVAMQMDQLFEQNWQKAKPFKS